ncbi:hypothetical protein Anas_02026, partial [Armadillidium nasatum]
MSMYRLSTNTRRFQKFCFRCSRGIEEQNLKTLRMLTRPNVRKPEKSAMALVTNQAKSVPKWPFQLIRDSLLKSVALLGITQKRLRYLSI